MNTSTRPLTKSEVAGLKPGIIAKLFRSEPHPDLKSGQVEILEFNVRRVWKLISCDGPPCCANTWLLDTGTEMVWVASFSFLNEKRGNFPGSAVTIERLPISKQVVGAHVSGATIAPENAEYSERLDAFDIYEDSTCHVLPYSQVPPRQWAVLNGD